MKKPLQLEKTWIFILALLCNLGITSQVFAAQYDLTFEVTLPADASGPAVLVCEIPGIGWDETEGSPGTMVLVSGKTYSITASVEEGSNIGYRFLKGYGWEEDEKSDLIANGCGVKWGNSRQIIMPAENTTVSHIWGTCESPSANTLTVKVDMTGYDTQHGVYIYGQSTNWKYMACTQEETSNIWKYDFTVSEGNIIDFAFCQALVEIVDQATQDDWQSYFRETVPSYISPPDRPRDYRRVVATGEETQVYDCLFYTDLPADTEQTPHLVTFLVDMTGQTVNSEGVYVMGNFDFQDGKKAKWKVAQMSQVESSDLYVYTLTMKYGQNETFSFSNGFGTNGSLREVLPVECRVSDNNANREFVIPDRDVTIGYKYGTCETVDFPTAFRDINADKIIIFPNPATDVITVEGAIEITIFNSLGEIVKTATNSVVDISDLVNGIYFVKADDEVIKLIKQ